MLTLKTLKIEEFRGNKEVEWHFFSPVSVLVGKNGSGKSTLIQIIAAILSEEYHARYSSAFSYLKKAELSIETEEQLIEKITVENRSNHKLSLGVLKKLLDTQQEHLNSQKNTEVKQKIDQLIAQMSEDAEMVIDVGTIEASQKGLQSSFQVDVISTVSMSANAINKITKSNGLSATVLDWEITELLKKLVEKADNSLQESFLSILNEFLVETHKKAFISEGELRLKLIENEEYTFDIEELSAGERQLIYILLKVAIAATCPSKKSVLLMDEPEISLHLSWQEQLLQRIIRLNDKAQIILVTHSPAIIMNGWMDSYTEINTILK